MFAQVGKQLLHGETRIDDVFDHDNGAVFNVLGQADELFYLAGALHALIAGEAHERNFGGNIDAAHEVGGEHEGAVENGKKERILSFEIAADLLRYLSNAFLQARCRNGNRELLVFYGYYVHRTANFACKGRKKMPKQGGRNSFLGENQ